MHQNQNCSGSIIVCQMRFVVKFQQQAVIVIIHIQTNSMNLNGIFWSIISLSNEEYYSQSQFVTYFPYSNYQLIENYSFIRIFYLIYLICRSFSVWNLFETVFILFIKNHVKCLFEVKEPKLVAIKTPVPYRQLHERLKLWMKNPNGIL